ncbi:trans-sulfuration enzyme family protein [Zavarzinella formosa]|uniref:trans-sulfuration enzyme family protein n=1 Tax=Zavarzinella formosa TaxID=360055 RepID=UPI0002D42153|nr:PLP-dependent aspartate aminotransferase family protein [Zavarzinella formosa]
MAFPPLGPTRPHTTPLFQSAVYDVPDLDALDRVMNGEEPGFFYARDAHPNARNLASQLALLEKGTWGFVTASGMAAISASLLAYVSGGDRILASNRLYGRTNRLMKTELARFGVTASFVDCNDLISLEVALQTPTKALIVETISNPLLRVVDLPALIEVCHRHGAKVIVDNTFATPVLCRPLEMGADMVMESLTKIISGHGDVTLGLLAGNDAATGESLVQLISTWGFSANPFDCWMCERGLGSLPLRMNASTQNAKELAEWFDASGLVKQVHYPNRPSHPDFALAGRLFPNGAGHMLCIELGGGREAVNCFMRAVPEITFSPSLGDLHTTISHPDTTSHRYDSTEEKLAQGITPGLIRVSVGIEPQEHLRNLFEKGLRLAGSC